MGGVAVALATEVDDPATSRTLLVQDGTASLMRGDHDGGVARITEAMSLARRHGWVDRVAVGLLQIGSGAGEVRRYDLAVPALRECIELTEQQEMGRARPTRPPGWPAARWSSASGTRPEPAPPGSSRAPSATASRG